jgi:hypothetical protein
MEDKFLALLLIALNGKRPDVPTDWIDQSVRAALMLGIKVNHETLCEKLEIAWKGSLTDSLHAELSRRIVAKKRSEVIGRLQHFREEAPPAELLRELADVVREELKLQ